ncbi:hypothetical protein ANN_19417 [Periplaneta americana]|uniref:Uncharacterized protein n=1 Tax=Periplaneta americana TaxID=6978 RepID=A0ABQ8S9V3_PERAM|nr:hypothetical protein ANN_19417 [Periplaneta americana]
MLGKLYVKPIRSLKKNLMHCRMEEKLSVANVLERTAFETDVSRRAVSRILNEAKLAEESGHTLSSPEKRGSIGHQLKRL